MSVRSKLWICATGLLACSITAVPAEVASNGIKYNGLRTNRIELNGLGMNGIHYNGLVYNGLELNRGVIGRLPAGQLPQEETATASPGGRGAAPRERPSFELTVDKGRLLVTPRREHD